MIPNKPGWWWWADSGPYTMMPKKPPWHSGATWTFCRGEFTVTPAGMPLYVGPDSIGDETPCLDWSVWHTKPEPDTPWGIVLAKTGRTVRTMGGVWLGPCEPPKPKETP